MIFLADATLRPNPQPVEFAEKSRQWWNEGGRPENLRFRSIIGAVGEGRHVLVLETDDVTTLRTLANFWNEFEFHFAPALDLADMFRSQGMRVE